MDSENNQTSAVGAVLWQRYGAALAFGLACLSIGLWGMSTQLSDTDAKAVYSPLPAPANAYADSLMCGAGLTRYVAYLGVEDGFARDNVEPSHVPDDFVQDEVLLSVLPHPGQIDGRRNYDEMGRDRGVIDTFKFPARLQSGWLIARIIPFPGASTDSISLHSERLRGTERDIFSAAATSLMSGEIVARSPDGSETRVWDLDSFHLRGTRGLEALLPSEARETDFTMGISFRDDHAVDAAIFVGCVKPPEPMGVTYVSSKRWVEEFGVHELSCSSSEALTYRCLPRRGDTPCRTELPLACVRDGSHVVPDVGKEHRFRPRIENYFFSGDVRLTAPIAGSSIDTTEIASGLCQAEFGPDWRILDYHEASGYTLYTISELPSGARVWVNERDHKQTCWSQINGQ